MCVYIYKLGGLGSVEHETDFGANFSVSFVFYYTHSSHKNNTKVLVLCITVLGRGEGADEVNLKKLKGFINFFGFGNRDILG